MKELVEHIAKALVDKPDEVVVTENGSALQIRVATSDQGRLIGRQGRTARSFRTIVTAAGLKQHKKVTLEIAD